MQSKNKNDSVQLSTRYQQYMFTKQHLRRTSRSEVFPIGESSSNANKTRCNEKCFTAIDANYYKGVGVRGNKCRACVKIKQLNQPKVQEMEQPTSSEKQSALRGARIRRLTPLEVERLQNFPDNFTAKGINEKGEDVTISDSSRYKVLGNAVTVCVVKEIIKNLLQN